MMAGLLLLALFFCRSWWRQLLQVRRDTRLAAAQAQRQAQIFACDIDADDLLPGPPPPHPLPLSATLPPSRQPLRPCVPAPAGDLLRESLRKTAIVAVTEVTRQRTKINA